MDTRLQGQSFETAYEWGLRAAETAIHQIILIVLRRRLERFSCNEPVTSLLQYYFMKKLMSCCLPLLLVFAQATSVNMAEDPTHSLVMENQNVRVWAVEVPRLKSTLFDRHDHNYVVIYLDESEVTPSGPDFIRPTNHHYDGEVRLFYRGNHVTERNESANAYRNFTVELLGKGGEWGYNNELQRWGYPPFDALGQALAPNITAVNSLDMGGMVAKRVQIMPGESANTGEYSGPTLVVALTDLELNAGQKTFHRNRGDVVWLAGGLPAAWKNIGRGPARVIALVF